MAKWKPNSASGDIVRGTANVLISKDGQKVKVDFLDNELDSKVLLREACPDELRKGKWVVSLTEKKMLSFHPVTGAYRVRVKEFTHKEGEEPSPKTYTGKFGDYKKFTVLLEVINGEAKGVTIPLFLSYNFAEGEEVDAKGRKVWCYDPGMRSSYTEQLHEFLDLSGVLDLGPMAYEDNLLPAFYRRIHHANKTFNVVLKDGYVDTMFESVDDLVAEPTDNELSSEGDFE